jgi:cell shape-determining protein MreC
MFVRIEEEKHLVRDTTNRAILNTDRAGLENYLAQRQLAKQKLAEQEEMKNKVNKLEEDITDIKGMLRELVQMKAPNGN